MRTSTAHFWPALWALSSQAALWGLLIAWRLGAPGSNSNVALTNLSSLSRPVACGGVFLMGVLASMAAIRLAHQALLTPVASLPPFFSLSTVLLLRSRLSLLVGVESAAVATALLTSFGLFPWLAVVWSEGALFLWVSALSGLPLAVLARRIVPRLPLLPSILLALVPLVLASAFFAWGVLQPDGPPILADLAGRAAAELRIWLRG